MIEATRRNFKWLVLLVELVCSIRVGFINDTEYQTISWIPVTVNGTCQQCICQHIAYAGSVSFVAFNCYTNERKCNLYLTYSPQYSLIGNPNSKFFFLEALPPLPVCYGRLCV
jgi:hypothetical protein